MKEFLSREGYAFVERNVEDDDEAYRELMALGVRSVPLTVAAGRSVKGFNEPALRDLLAAAGGS